MNALLIRANTQPRAYRVALGVIISITLMQILVCFIVKLTQVPCNDQDFSLLLHLSAFLFYVALV